MYYNYKNQSKGASTANLLERAPESRKMCTVKVRYNNKMGTVVGKLANGSFLRGKSDDVTTLTANVNNGDNVYLEAQPLKGFRFVKWVTADKLPVPNVETPAYNFNVHDSVSLVAEFAAVTDEPSHNVNPEETNNPENAEEPGTVQASTVAGLLKKYWWAVALLALYFLLKEDK